MSFSSSRLSCSEAFMYFRTSGSTPFSCNKASPLRDVLQPEW
jgi:hypothetical protein